MSGGLQTKQNTLVVHYYKEVVTISKVVNKEKVYYIHHLINLLLFLYNIYVLLTLLNNINPFTLEQLIKFI